MCDEAARGGELIDSVGHKMSHLRNTFGGIKMGLINEIPTWS